MGPQVPPQVPPKLATVLLKNCKGEDVIMLYCFQCIVHTNLAQNDYLSITTYSAHQTSRATKCQLDLKRFMKCNIKL